LLGQHDPADQPGPADQHGPENPDDRLENPVDPVVSRRDDPVGAVVWVADAYNVTPEDLQDPEEVEFPPGEVR
jgi:hypothetical protein